MKNGGKVKKVNRKKVRDGADDDDEEYEGGGKAKVRKSENQAGFLSFFGLGKKEGVKEG